MSLARRQQQNAGIHHVRNGIILAKNTNQTPTISYKIERVFQNSSQQLPENTPLALSIVKQSFHDVYEHLTTSCPTNTTFEDCLNQTLYENDNNTTDMPWWFQTMVRDAPISKIDGVWHFQRAPNVTSRQESLEFCLMEKIGSKHFRRLFCHLQDKPIIRSRSCFYRGDLPENSTKKSVFLRDPLERFLSGFLDKCLDELGVTEGHCEPTTIFGNENYTSHLSKRQLFEAFVESFPLKWNMHFYPQSFYCDGLFRHFSSYDFVGIMGPNFYRDLRRMGVRYGAKMKRGLDHVFDLKEHRHNRNVGIERSAPSHVYEYYTPKTVERVLQYYAIDYSMFQLPIPNWAEAILQQQDDDSIV